MVIETKKVILIGCSGVGKTSIITRYVTDSFQQSSVPSVGCDMQAKTVTVDERTYKLYIWDTAGQERLRTLNQLYYRGAEGVIIVYGANDEGNSMAAIAGWLAEAKAFAQPEAVIAIAANKYDLVRNTDLVQEIQRFAETEGYLHLTTSAKTGENIDELYESLARRFKVKDKVTCTESQEMPITLHHQSIETPRLKRGRARKCIC